MKFIHNYRTVNEFDEVYNGDGYLEPWISYTHENDHVDYNKRICEFVDLGLPSGTLWAKWNVGASRPEEYGGYYAWGEIEEKDIYDIDGYKWFEADYGYNKYNDDDNIYELFPEDDVATQFGCQVEGYTVQMPTNLQCEELLDETIWEWCTMNGVHGYKFISPVNQNYIFIPAAGLKREYDDEYEHFHGLMYEDEWFGIWTKTREYEWAWGLNGDENGIGMWAIDTPHDVYGVREMGLPIRPVLTPEPAPGDWITIDFNLDNNPVDEFGENFTNSETSLYRVKYLGSPNYVNYTGGPAYFEYGSGEFTRTQETCDAYLVYDDTNNTWGLFYPSC